MDKNMGVGTMRIELILVAFDTPTAKAVGFLLHRPLHCRKDFSFT